MLHFKTKMQINPSLLVATSAELELGPNLTFPAPKSLRHSFLHLLFLFQEIFTLQIPKSGSNGKIIHPNSEPFSVQQLQHFQGMERDKSSCTQQRMMTAKETLNLALWAAAGGAQHPAHPWDAAPKPGRDSPPLKSSWDAAMCASKTATTEVHSHCCGIYIKGKNNFKEIQPQVNQETEK